MLQNPNFPGLSIPRTSLGSLQRSPISNVVCRPIWNYEVRIFRFRRTEKMDSVVNELMGQCPPPQNFWARTVPGSFNASPAYLSKICGGGGIGPLSLQSPMRMPYIWQQPWGHATSWSRYYLGWLCFGRHSPGGLLRRTVRHGRFLLQQQFVDAHVTAEAARSTGWFFFTQSRPLFRIIIQCTSQFVHTYAKK